jgi:hypothetical protein
MGNKMSMTFYNTPLLPRQGIPMICKTLPERRTLMFGMSHARTLYTAIISLEHILVHIQYAHRLYAREPFTHVSQTYCKYVRIVSHIHTRREHENVVF